MTNWASRPYKALMRDYQLEADQPRRAAIFLPGWDTEAATGCLCIQRALEMGVVDLTTKIIAVEREPALIDNIARRLKSFGFKTPPVLHHGELADLRLTPKTIDFAMIDLLGTLDHRLAHWIEHDLGPSFVPGASMSITLTRTYRNNYFMEESRFVWRNDTTLRRLAIRYGQEHGITDDEVLIHLVILKSCLAAFDADYQRVQLYRDNQRTMLACRFDNLTRRRPIWPTTATVLAAVSTVS